MRTKKPVRRVHSGERKLHLPDATWTYRIGHGNVKIRDPNGFATVINYSDVTGWSWNDIERGVHKGYFKLRPSDIKAYIEKNLTVRTK